MKRAKLLAARYSKGWTQEEAAEQIGVIRGTISQWERGVVAPHPFYVHRLCTVFEKTASELDLEKPLSETTVQQEKDPSHHDFLQKLLVIAQSTLVPTLHQEIVSESHENPSVTNDVDDFDSAPLSDVVQLEQKEHALEQEVAAHSHEPGAFQYSESEMFIPFSFHSVIPLKGGALWFILKQSQWEDLVHFYEEQVLLCGELQQHLNEEFRSMDVESHDQEYIISRRQAIGVLVALPLALLTKVQIRHVPLRPEEFLPRCAASITSCWELLNSDGIPIIKDLLPTYLPTLVTLAKQPSRYQRVAASLSAQGCLLMELVSYHQLRFQDALSYATQATELAHLAEEANLHAYTLLILGSAYNLHGQKRMMLEKHQEALHSLNMVVPALQSYILAELAYSYAENGYIQEALGYIREARARFPENIGGVPSFVSADYSLSQLVTFEGLTHLSLGEQATGNDALNYNTQANTMFSQIESFSTEVILPERTRVEITNQRALAAMRMGDLEQFEQYFIQGVQGAQALGSQKRKDEAKANWREARQRWPHEKKIVDLADLLVDIF